MAQQPNHFYEFGPFRLDTRERLLDRDGQMIPLTPKLFDILLVLVRNSGHILEKDEMISQVWHDTAVEQTSLARNISTLRKILGENPNEPQYIETIPWRGYRFVASVREVWDENTDFIVEEHSRSHIIIEEVEDTDRRSEAEQVTQPRRPATNLSRAGLGPGATTSSVIPFPRASSRSSSKSGEAEAAALKTIAVLPFKYVSATDSDEYLGPGMADVLTTRLSQIRQLIVRPTSAVLKYTGLEQDTAVAGRELEVESVLDGRIHRSGETVRVTVQLVDVASSAIIWADKFDEKLTDIFMVEDRVSEQVTAALLLKLTGEERRLLAKRHTRSGEAYQAYLKGRYYWNKRTAEGLKKAAECFEQALGEDDRYGPAYAGLADCYNVIGNFAVLPPKVAYSKAKEAATRALEIDDTLAEAHTSLGYAHWSIDWDWPAAEREYRRAIELNPNYATARHWYALYLASMGRPDEAVREVKRARELDPASLIINAAVGWILYLCRQYDQAIIECKNALEMEPDFYLTHLYLGWAYGQKGMHEEAIAEGQKALALSGNGVLMLGSLGYNYALAGKRDEAQKIIYELNKLSEQRYVPAIYTAVIYTALGQADDAMGWLEKAFEERSNWLTLLKVDPKVDAVRSDARFRDLLRRLGLAA